MSSPQIKRKYYYLYSFTVVLYLAISAGLYFYFSYNLNETIEFEKENSKAVAESRAIQSFTLEFGYGAFIHNYKNYLLRRNPNFYNAAIENYKAMENDLLMIERMNQSSREYASRIRVIRRTMASYYRNLLSMKSDFADREIQDIDKVIKLNDAPAVEAIKWIGKSISDKQHKIKLSFHNHIHQMIHKLNIASISLTFFFLVLFTYVFRKIRRLQVKSDEERQNRIHLSRIQEIQEMSGGIAHEINNPLMIISGSAVSLKKMLMREEPMIDKAIEKADMITDTVGRISTIVKSMKNLTHKSETKTWNIFLLSETLEDILNISKDRFKHAQISIEIVGDTDITLFGQRNQIAQVILNLFNNAYDAIKNENQKWIKLEIKNYPSSVEIDVIDSGPKIPKSVINKLMIPFFTTKEMGKGTGIGLSITKAILNDHGGDIQFIKGAKNTTFRVTLPTDATFKKLAS